MSRTLPRKDSVLGKKYRQKYTIKQEIDTENGNASFYCPVPIKTETKDQCSEETDPFDFNREVLFNERTAGGNPIDVLGIKARCVWDVLREAMEASGEIRQQNYCGTTKELTNLWDEFEGAELPEGMGLGVKVKIEETEVEGDRCIQRDVSVERKELEEYYDRQVCGDGIFEEDHDEDFKHEEGEVQDGAVREVIGEKKRSEEVISEEVIGEEVIGEEVIGEEVIGEDEIGENSIGGNSSNEGFDDDAHTAWSDNGFVDSGEEWVPEEGSEMDDSEQEEVESLEEEVHHKTIRKSDIQTGSDHRETPLQLPSARSKTWRSIKSIRTKSVKRSLAMPVEREEVSEDDMNIAKTVFEETSGELSYVEKKFPCIDLLITKTVTGHTALKKPKDVAKSQEGELRPLFDGIQDENEINCDISDAANERKESEVGWIQRKKKRYGSCKVCGKKMLLRSIALHMRIHNGDKRFKCDICGQAFVQKHHLRSHKGTHTGHERLFTCDTCGKKFTSSSYLVVHNRLHKADPRYACETCGKFCLSKSALDHHRMRHSSKRPFVCDLCGRDYKARSHLNRHLRIHSNHKPYACEHCSYKSSSRSHLNRHIATVHTDEKKYECDVCHKKFKRPENVTLHKTTHDESKPFCCDLCDYRTSRKSHLKNHKLVHSDEKIFKCDMCPFEYRDRCSLKRHKREHLIKKPYSCDLCDRRFAVKKELANHIKYHTQEPRVKKYNCDLCKMAFACRSHLIEHKLTHTGEKPYVCEHCGNRYRQRTSYVRHIRKIHEGDKPWVCKICSKAFVGKTDLRYHQWTHEER